VTTKGKPNDGRHGATLPLEALEALYRDVDARSSGHGCPGSTECCRFGITGREPYVTSVEVALLARAVAASGRRPGTPLKPARRALPLARDERTCPLLMRPRDGEVARCSVYAARPLGCRTFWCHRATKDAALGQHELNDFVRRVREIAADHQRDGERGAPLSRAIAAWSKR
jgi:Fe-S-cluster containining protein